jgi:NAD(P)-dependent dehydrogenase (short-subunit alcohol dehydrogenase family)
MKKAVIITGSNGGIGAALKAKFSEEGYAVIGIGKSADSQCCDDYIQTDFSVLVKNSVAREDFSKALLGLLAQYELKALINNSATQILAPMDQLTFEDFQETLGVNVSIPFLLSKICLGELEKANGSIVNVGSIHAKLTKKNFIAYATSKGALETMTKAMAVDIGDRVRVNLIAPAAIETDMLKAGFVGAQEKYIELEQYHPVGKIGAPGELAEFVSLLVVGGFNFLNGAVIDYSGGIHSKLHDPQ